MGWWLVDIDGVQYEVDAKSKLYAVQSALQTETNSRHGNYQSGQDWQREHTMIAVKRIEKPPKKRKPNPRNWLPDVTGQTT